MRLRSPSTLIATLGSKAQIITLALDCLAQTDTLPRRVTVIHTRAERPETAQALERLREDFPCISLPSSCVRSNCNGTACRCRT